MAEVARQYWSAQRYAETAHFVPALGAPVLESLATSPGERILDLGCGDGVLTEKIVAAGATVVAVDAAPDTVAAARARGLDARVMAGQNLTFDREFDAVFSNAALHWMRPPEAVLARYGLDAHRLSPWYFPSAEAYRKKLESAGFSVEEITVVPRPPALPTGVEPWLDMFAENFLGAVPESDRLRARAENRRSATACPYGRNRHLDRRLRPAALPRDPRRMRATPLR